MKRLLTLAFLVSGLNLFSQSAIDNKPHLGIKAGYNIARLAGTTPDFKPQSKNGFMLAGFFSRDARSGPGYRTELVFSRQGFAFSENGTKEDVTSDYIYMPHFTTFGITKFVQLQMGLQAGYLLKSAKTNNAVKIDPTDITALYNRLDYGAAGGIEIYPIKGLLIGGRYNLSFGKLYKDEAGVSIPGAPLPIPFPLPVNPMAIKNKNAVINFYLGFKF